MSTYKPLLAFYEEGETWVYLLSKNYGSYALWHADFIPWPQHASFFAYIDSYTRFVLTDPDLLFTEEAPHDWLLYFWTLLDSFCHFRTF